jgi:hypothetical protein
MNDKKMLRRVIMGALAASVATVTAADVANAKAGTADPGTSMKPKCESTTHFTECGPGYVQHTRSNTASVWKTW